MKAVLLVLAVLLSAPPAHGQNKTPSSQFSIRDMIEGTADAWRNADAVIYLRIADTNPWVKGRIAEFGGLSVLHTAVVKEVVKADPVNGPTGETMAFLQAGSTNESPYAKGDEFIAFLKWSGDMFVRSSGPSSVYVVKEGKIAWLNLGRDIPYSTETLTVRDFIARLRNLPK